MTPVFGKSFDVSYTVRVGGETVEPFSLTSARLYSDVPTEAQRADHSHALADAVESVTSWTPAAAAGEYQITFAAITDAEPNDAADYEKYYLVVSAVLESGGSNVFIPEEVVRVYRPDAILSRVSIVPGDVKDLDDKLEILLSNEDIEEKISRASRRVEKRLEGKGLELDRVDQQDLDEVVLYLAIMYCCRSLSSESGDIWREKANDYKEEYNELWGQITIGYDVDDNNDVEPGEDYKISNSIMVR